jgi:hypothetical protein
MRCNDCNKFRSPQIDDSNVNVVDITLDGDQVLVTVEVDATCEECGGTMAAASWDDSTNWVTAAEGAVDPKEHEPAETKAAEGEADEDAVEPEEPVTHDLTVEEGDVEDVEITEAKVDGKRVKVCAVTLGYRILCECQDDPLFEGTLVCRIPMASFEEE